MFLTLKHLTTKIFRKMKLMAKISIHILLRGYNEFKLSFVKQKLTYIRYVLENIIVS